MLSLNKLTTLVQVRDNVYPVTIHHEIEISSEDSYDEPEEEDNRNVTYLLNMARRHKSLSKVKSEKYYPAWVQSMQRVLIDNWIEETEFLQLCLKA